MSASVDELMRLYPNLLPALSFVFVASTEGENTMRIPPIEQHKNDGITYDSLRIALSLLHQDKPLFCIC